MHDGAVRHPLVKEALDAHLAAGLHDVVHEGVVIGDEGRPLPGQIIAQEALDKVAVGLVAPHEAGQAVAHLDDAHGQGVEEMPVGVGLLVADDAEVIEVDLADGLVIGNLRRVFIAELQMARAKTLHQKLRRGGLAEEEALQLAAADLLQKALLLLGLHALADRVRAEAGRELHELRQDDPARFALVELLHEAHVEFHGVEADALQRVQRGIAAAEVVQPDREAERAEALDLLLHAVKVAADDALGDLHGDQAAVHARGVHAPADLLHHVAGVEVRPGEVDGMGDEGIAGVLHDPVLFQHLLEHIEVELVDQPRVLQIGDKAARRQDSVLRVDPARQRLLVADVSVGRADDGLVIDPDPVLGDGPVQILADMAAARDVLLQRGVVVAEVGHDGVAQLVAGDLGPVAGLADRVVRVAVPADADAQRQRIAAVQALAGGEQPRQALLDPRLLRQHDEVVLPDAAAVLVAEGRGQKLRQLQQQAVALDEAVFVVVELHAAEVQIEDHRAPAGAQEVCPLRPGQLEEVGHPRQPGQKIVAVGRNDALLAALRLLCAGALVRVPDLRKADALIRVGVDAQRVYVVVIRAARDPRPIAHVIAPAFGCKVHGGVRDAGDVVRVGVLVHVVIHVVVGLRPVRITEQLAKAVRQYERDDAPVHELIDRKGNLHPLHQGLLRERKLIFFHGLVSPFFSKNKRFFLLYSFLRILSMFIF